jgi:hypothetical protein
MKDLYRRCAEVYWPVNYIVYRICNSAYDLSLQQISLHSPSTSVSINYSYQILTERKISCRSNSVRFDSTSKLLEEM